MVNYCEAEVFVPQIFRIPHRKLTQRDLRNLASFFTYHGRTFNVSRFQNGLWQGIVWFEGDNSSLIHSLSYQCAYGPISVKSDGAWTWE